MFHQVVGVLSMSNNNGKVFLGCAICHSCVPCNTSSCMAGRGGSMFSGLARVLSCWWGRERMQWWPHHTVNDGNVNIEIFRARLSCRSATKIIPDFGGVSENISGNQRWKPPHMKDTLLWDNKWYSLHLPGGAKAEQNNSTQTPLAKDWERFFFSCGYSPPEHLLPARTPGF